MRACFYIKKKTEYIKQALSGNPKVHSIIGSFSYEHAQLDVGEFDLHKSPAIHKINFVCTKNIIAFHQISGSQSCTRFQTNRVASDFCSLKVEIKKNSKKTFSKLDKYKKTKKKKLCLFNVERRKMFPGQMDIELSRRCCKVCHKERL